MKIAVASGKGGTGKTLVATSLALALERAVLVDCDVEEPNAQLLVNPEWKETEAVELLYPEVDLAKCTFCRECQRVCRFGAIVVLLDKVMTFYELCHSCGGCALVCPMKAIKEVKKKVGEIRLGKRDGIVLYEGRLDIGQPMPSPVIKAVKRKPGTNKLPIIYDAPPGTSCPVIHSLKGADFALLVTEPTPFGLNDLKLAVGVARQLGILCGIIINRVGIGDDRVHNYCQEQGLEILLEIPEDRKIAEGYSRGLTLSEVYPEYKERFLEVYQKIAQRVERDVGQAISGN